MTETDPGRIIIICDVGTCPLPTDEIVGRDARVEQDIVIMSREKDWDPWPLEIMIKHLEEYDKKEISFFISEERARYNTRKDPGYALHPKAKRKASRKK